MNCFSLASQGDLDKYINKSDFNNMKKCKGIMIQWNSLVHITWLWLMLVQKTTSDLCLHVAYFLFTLSMII